MRKETKPKPPLESDEQSAFITWCRATARMQKDERKKLALEWLHSIPNGSMSQRARTQWQKDKNLPTLQALKMKREGLTKGIPDLFLPYGFDRRYSKEANTFYTHHGLYIEFKRFGGKLRPEQMDFAFYAKESGYVFCMAYFWQQAAEVIVSYMELEKHCPIGEPLYLRVMQQWK